MQTDDPVLDAFLFQQLDEARELERKSTVMELAIVDGSPPQRYVATFHAKGLVRNAGGVEQANVARFGIWLPDDYLKDDVDLAHLPIATYLGPHPNPFHPQILPFPPFAVCIHMVPGTPLTALIRAVYEVWTYQLVGTWDNGLNPKAASYSRAQPQERFPIDSRPLTGRRSGMKVRVKRVMTDRSRPNAAATNGVSQPEDTR